MQFSTRGAAAALVLGSWLVPARLLHATPTLCPVRALSGRPCPTCGMSRSWNAAARLRLRDSVGYHPLGPLTLLGTAAVALTSDDDRAVWAREHRPAIAAMLTVWLGVWLLRFTRSR